VEVPPECRGRRSNCASLVPAGMAATPLIAVANICISPVKSLSTMPGKTCTPCKVVEALPRIRAHI
jgi:hypothetical protein